MKLLKFSFLIALMFAVSSCSDDESDCIVADWIGTYSGTQECDDVIGLPVAVVVTITASGTDAIIITYETDEVEFELEPITPEDCEYAESSMENGITVAVDATLDGDNLSFTDIITFDGESTNCVITATRN